MKRINCSMQFKNWQQIVSGLIFWSLSMMQERLFGLPMSLNGSFLIFPWIYVLNSY